MKKADSNSLIPVPKELLDRVEQKITSGLDVVNKHYSVSLPFPDIKYSVHSSVAGYACVDTWSIELNPTLLYYNPEPFIAEIPLHELGHLVTDTLFPLRKYGNKRRRIHGKRWQRVMDVLGAPYNGWHTFDVSMFSRSPYIYECPSCGEQYPFGQTRHKNVLNGRHYRCREDHEGENTLLFRYEQKITLPKCYVP
jgi:predicted SprT family Zn-dependent metalloprotease